MISHEKATTLGGLAAVLILCSSPVYPYAYGYTRLYRPDTQAIVDIVYDVHTPTRALSHGDMEVFLCDDIKQGLYPTEKVFVESLEHLNQAHPHDVTVIWEHAPHFYPAEVHLLTYPQRLVINRLRNIKFVSADTWRVDYPGCIASLLGGGSLAHRVNRQAIIENSGNQVWGQYQTLMGATLRDVIATYAPHKDRVRNSQLNDQLYKNLFFAKAPYSKLADLEMLSHILGSPHHHIVLFAGGAHGESIADFLRCYAPYEVVHSVVDRHFNEINPQELKRITQEYGRRPSVPKQRTERSAPTDPVRRPQRVSKPTSKAFEKGKPSYGLKPAILAKSSLSDAQRKQLTVGGALVLGGIMASAYFEHKRNPGVEMMTIAKRNLLTTLKYGALPSALLYLWMQNPQQVS